MKIHSRRATLWGLLLVALNLLQPLPAPGQTIEWIRQFGSSSRDGAIGISADATGVYVVGSTDGALLGQISAGETDAYVRKYDALGNELWTRQFGTVNDDEALDVAADSTGVYVVGSTSGTLPDQTKSGVVDAFVRSYGTNGNELWTRQFGSSSGGVARGVAVDATGVYVAGSIFGSLPNQAGSGGGDVFVRKYDLNGTEIWTRQFGTAFEDIARSLVADTSGIYVVGTTGGVLPGQPGVGGDDAFVRKFDGDGNELWTRQFGSISGDYPQGVAVDLTGIYTTGYTFGTFPGQTSAGGADAFVRKYDTSGNELWSRQFGSVRNDPANGVAANATGIYVGGYTDFGTLPGQTSSGEADPFVRKYDASGNEQWTRQFGTTGRDLAHAIAADAGRVYLAGSTSATWPGQSTSGDFDAFVTKVVQAPPPIPLVSDGGVVNNASFAPNPAPVAPGSIAAVFGNNLNDGSSVQFSSYGPDGKLVTSLGGASATINNIPAPMFYSFLGQLGAQIPFELAGQTSAQIVVTVAGQSSIPRTINLDALAPGIFTVNQQGTLTAAVLHEDGITPVTAQNPAHPNEVVVFFGTGLGVLTPALATGARATENRTVSIPLVMIDGVAVVPDFSGAAPGFVGLNQINVRIPANTRTSPSIPVVLTIGGRQSNQVTLPVGP